MEIKNYGQQQIFLQIGNHIFNFSKTMSISIYENQIEAIFENQQRAQFPFSTKDFSSVTPSILSYGKNAVTEEPSEPVLVIKVTP